MFKRCMHVGGRVARWIGRGRGGGYYCSWVVIISGGPQTPYIIDCFFGFLLLFSTDCVSVELVDRTAFLYEVKTAVEGGQIVFPTLRTTI
jgi:hypothetical protein